MNTDHSAIFETASKYCILDSLVDYDGYSTSSKGFLPSKHMVIPICTEGWEGRENGYWWKGFSLYPNGLTHFKEHDSRLSGPVKHIRAC